MSLSKMCLDVIIDNFEVYISQYESELNLKNLEFLQKKYSYELACEMYSRTGKLDGIGLPKRYLDFLLNRFLRKLDYNWLDNTDVEWDFLSKKFPEVGPHLEEMYFRVSNGPSGMLSGHRWEMSSDHPWEKLFDHLQLKNIKKICFNKCTDKAIEAVAKFCPKLESIEIGDPNFSPSSGLKILCRKSRGLIPCQYLKDIKIDINKSSTIEDLAIVIQNNRCLENIECRCLDETLYFIHKNDIDALDHIRPYNFPQSLTISGIKNPHFNERIKICSHLCKNVKYLNCAVLTEEHLNMITKFTQLQELVLKNENYDEELTLDPFFKVKQNISTLHIYNFSVSVSTLLEMCPQLNELHASGVRFHYSERDRIPIAYGLESVHFHHCVLIDPIPSRAIASLLSASPNVRELHFEKCAPFSPVVRAAVLNSCENGKLKRISLDGSSVNSKFAHDILNACSSLTFLSLMDTFINELGEIQMLENVARNLPNRPIIKTQLCRTMNNYVHDAASGEDSIESDEEMNI